MKQSKRPMVPTWPKIKSAPLRQSDIDAPDNRPVTPKGCLVEVLKLCAFMVCGFALTYGIWVVIYG
jgi:hypothetical protein